MHIVFFPSVSPSALSCLLSDLLASGWSICFLNKLNLLSAETMLVVLVFLLMSECMDHDTATESDLHRYQQGYKQ